MKNNYKSIGAQGVNIRSISADTDETVFKTNSNELPWTDKYCNLDRTNDVNFRNYALISTPIMYILDRKGGIIAKITKIATIDEFLIWLKTIIKGERKAIFNNVLGITAILKIVLKTLLNLKMQ